MKRVKLEEILDVKRGTTLSGEHYSSSGNYIRLTLGNFNYPGRGFKANTSKDDIYFTGKVRDEFILHKGDIITPLTEQVSGLLGETARIPEDNKYIQSGDIGLVIPNEKLLNKSYAYYLVSSPIIKKQLDVSSQQTKIRHTSPDKIKDCIAWIPEDVTKQKKIAEYLDSINNKILLNDSIIMKLDSMIETIFNYCILQNSTNLTKTQINKVVDLVSGYPFSSEDYSVNGKYKLYTIGNVQDGYIESIVDNRIMNIPTNMPNDCLLKEGDMLMSLTGNVGRIGLVYDEDALLNQRVLKIKCKNNKSFIYSLFKNKGMQRRFELASTGTSQKNLSPIDIGNMVIEYPKDDVLNSFEKMCEPLLDMMVKKRNENLKFKKILDRFIPLTINGQLFID